MKLKKIFITFIVLLIYLLFSNFNIYAANMGISINKSSAYIGDNFTVTVSGINGYVNIKGNGNVTVSPNGNVWVDGSLSITGTAKAIGTGTVTVTPVSETSVSTTGASPEFVKNSASKSISIIEKPAPQPQQTQQPETQSKPQQNTNNKTSTNTNNNNKKQTTNQKQEVKQTEIKEEATPQFGIYSLMLEGVKENGEKQELTFSPTFNIDTYEYNVEVENDINSINVITDAGEYQEFVKVENNDKLNTGENEILIKMQNEDNNLTYKIKVIKKESPISEEVNNEPIDPQMNVRTISSTITIEIWKFVLIILLVMIIEAILLKWKNIIEMIKRHKNN